MAPLSAARVAAELSRGRAVVFAGFMGAGKSTAARELAQALGVEALDSDQLLEERLGHSIAEEFARGGESSFRAAEEQLVCELLARAQPGAVIALGGGSVLSERVRTALARHLTVLLEIDPDRAWERVRTGERASERPLALSRERFFALYSERLPVYERIADALLPGGREGVAARAARSLRALADGPPGARMVWAAAASGEYPVLVARGLLGEPLLQSPLWPLDPASSRPFVVSDETVARLYGERLGSSEGLITIPKGELHKTLAGAEAVWHALVRGGMTRGDHVVALGGGVVGDLAGFCAATYQRGVPVVHVPTTLVAQVDSAYGGKTGVDLPEAKNYVGAYHQPAGVFVDPDALHTLPERECNAGWVEALKTALIAGGALWERVADGRPVDEEVILACARIKLAVVCEDERDAGRRQVLNLGHTVGHAIETATGYSRLLHGEAVGLGLLAALRLSRLADLRDRVFELLRARNLPTSLRGVELQSVLVALQRDKKRIGAQVPFVLLDAPGRVRTGALVAESELRSAIAELL
jgi:shikimate kinase/3-dehydroquinate synthase